MLLTVAAAKYLRFEAADGLLSSTEADFLLIASVELVMEDLPGELSWAKLPFDLTDDTDKGPPPAADAATGFDVLLSLEAADSIYDFKLSPPD